MIVRRFHPGEAAAVYAVFHRAVHEGAAAHYDAEQRNAWAPAAELPESWPAWLARERTWVGEEDGEILGFMLLEEDGLLDMAFVLPEWRGRGVADAMLGTVLADARQLGLARLRTEASLLARPFFLRHGWTEGARQEIERRGVRMVNFRMHLDL